MASITVYPVVSGASCLVEYRGAASSVVALTPYALGIQPARLRDMKLGTVRSQPLASLSSFDAALQNVLLTLPLVLLTDANGIAHLILPTQSLSAGVQIYVEGRLIA